MAETVQDSPAKVYSKKDVSEFLGEIQGIVNGSESAHIQSLLALNHLLRLENATELFDADLKLQAKEIWLQLRSDGIDLADPPLLFSGDSVGKTKAKASNGKVTAKKASTAKKTKS